jgi:hypothetical protein
VAWPPRLLGLVAALGQHGLVDDAAEHRAREDDVRQGEDRVPRAVVAGDARHRRPVAELETPAVDTPVEHALGERRGGEEGRVQAVLVEARDGEVADDGEALADAVARRPDRHVRVAHADGVEPGAPGEGALDVREVEEALHDLQVLRERRPVDALAEQDHGRPSPLRDQGRKLDAQALRAVGDEVHLAAHGVAELLLGLHLDDEGLAHARRAEAGEHVGQRGQQRVRGHLHVRRAVDARRKHGEIRLDGLVARLARARAAVRDHGSAVTGAADAADLGVDDVYALFSGALEQEGVEVQMRVRAPLGA